MWFFHIVQKSKSNNCRAIGIKPFEEKVTEVFMRIYNEVLCNLVIKNVYFLAGEV